MERAVDLYGCFMQRAQQKDYSTVWLRRVTGKLFEPTDLLGVQGLLPKL